MSDTQQEHEHEHLDEEGMHELLQQLSVTLVMQCPCANQQMVLLGMMILGIAAEVSESDRKYRDNVDDIVNLMRRMAKQGRNISDQEREESRIILPPPRTLHS